MFKDPKTGQPIDTSKLDPALVAVLGAIHAGVTVAVDEAVGKAVEPIKTTLTEQATAITELKSKPATDPKPDDKSPAKPGDKPSADDAVAKLAERLEKLEGGITSERERATASAAIASYLKANHPNLTGELRDAIAAKLLAGGAKDEATIKAAIENEQRVLKLAGGDTALKPFSAKVADEGGKGGEADQSKADAEAKLATLNASLAAKRA